VERGGSLPHPIITRPGAGTHHDSEFGHVGTCDCRDELGAVLGYTALFGVGADHEATDVLEEDERDASLSAELDEVCAFERRLGEENAVVGDYADLVAVYSGEA